MTRRISISLADSRPTTWFRKRSSSRSRFFRLIFGIPAFAVPATSLECDLPVDQVDDPAFRRFRRCQARAGKPSPPRAQGRIQQSRRRTPIATEHSPGRAARGAFSRTGSGRSRRYCVELFRYFDRTFEELGQTWNARASSYADADPGPRAREVRLLPLVSSKRDVCVASRSEHADDRRLSRCGTPSARRLDDAANSDMETPDTCLSPATCYHVYHLHAGKTIPAAGTVHGVCGKCFRFESTNTSDLRRLWDFTMREVVFMGTRDQVMTAT